MGKENCNLRVLVYGGLLQALSEIHIPSIGKFHPELYRPIFLRA
jgi:hypothetical protein